MNKKSAVTQKTQFSIDAKIKNRLDKYKAEHKEAILAKYRLKRMYVSNTQAIEFLLDSVNAK